MAKVEASAAPTKAGIVRDPLAIGSAVLTIAATVLYVLPAFGIKLPAATQKVASTAFTIASALGLKVTVKPS